MTRIPSDPRQQEAEPRLFRLRSKSIQLLPLRRALSASTSAHATPSPMLGLLVHTTLHAHQIPQRVRQLNSLPTHVLRDAPQKYGAVNERKDASPCLMSDQAFELDLAASTLTSNVGILSATPALCGFVTWLARILWQPRSSLDDIKV